MEKNPKEGKNIALDLRNSLHAFIFEPALREKTYVFI
jgi:hypothetical protein